MGENCSIFSTKNFEAMAGREALNYTIEYQTAPEGTDLYAPYYNTCENGDAHPTLPILMRLSILCFHTLYSLRPIWRIQKIGKGQRIWDSPSAGHTVIKGSFAGT